MKNAEQMLLTKLRSMATVRDEFRSRGYALESKRIEIRMGYVLKYLRKMRKHK